MMQRFGTTVLAMVIVLLYSQPVRGLGGGTKNGGAFTRGAADDTGVREWLTLAQTGDVLSGWPHHPGIALITVYAPGVERGHLILRELASADGSTSLLLSAPASLEEKTRRVTLYLRSHTPHVVLLEYAAGKWQHRAPQPMQVTTADGGWVAQEHLWAFTMAGFGPYRWFARPAADVSTPPGIVPAPSARALVGGGASRGVLPWVWSGVLLLVGWVTSRILHRIERRAGRS